MRLIDADILFEQLGDMRPKNRQQYEDIEVFMYMVTYSKTVERPTCETCTMWDKNRHYCTGWDSFMGAEDYCSLHEEKEGELK